jgi:hypothetical protein
VSGVSHVFERWAGIRDGEGSSLAKFGYRENWDGEKDILAIEVPSLLERCFA